MVTDFSALKRNQNVLFEKLNTEITNQKRGGFLDEDEGFWKLTRDKAKNGYAIIRFLPAPPNEDVPFVTYWDHGFQGPTGKWYVERSLTSIGLQDPVTEYNSKLWDTGLEKNKKQAREQKRRQHYVSNILVVNDPAKPENNGKVFKYRYGKKIFEFITDAIQPSEEEMKLDPDLKPINVFDPWEGANFKLKSYDADGWVSYNKSEFEKPKSIGTDEEIEKIWKSCVSLKEELSPSKYKTYDELDKKFRMVLGLGGASTPNEAEVQRQEKNIEKATGIVDDDIPFDVDDKSSVDSSADDDLDFFEKLAS